MRKCGLIIIVSLLALSSLANQYLPAPGKFMACEHENGSGLFIVDTTTGRTWWTDQGEAQWRLIGQPEKAAPAAIGTYLLVKNKGGEGVFIVNTATGQAAWTDGVQWKNIGVPKIQ